MKLLYVQFVVLFLESHSTWSAVTKGDDFVTFFSRMKGNLVKQQKESKHDYKPQTGSNKRSFY